MRNTIRLRRIHIRVGHFGPSMYPSLCLADSFICIAFRSSDGILIKLGSSLFGLRREKNEGVKSE